MSRTQTSYLSWRGEISLLIFCWFSPKLFNNLSQRDRDCNFCLNWTQVASGKTLSVVKGDSLFLKIWFIPTPHPISACLVIKTYLDWYWYTEYCQMSNSHLLCNFTLCGCSTMLSVNRCLLDFHRPCRLSLYIVLT